MTLTAASSAAETAIRDALSAYAEGDVAKSSSILSVAADTARAQRDLEGTFGSCCVRATLAALGGSTDVASILRPASAAEEYPATLTYLEGVAALSRGALTTALEKFDETRRQDDTFVLANLGKAACFFQLGKYADSFRQYRVVLETLGSELAPPVTRVGLGLCAFYLNDAELAKKFLERAAAAAAAADSGTSEGAAHAACNELALFGLLIVQLDQRDVAAAASTVMRLRRLLPGNALVLLQVADLMYFKAAAQRRTREAAPAITEVLARVRAVGTEEQCARADYQEGRLRFHCGDLEAAARLLESALRTLPHLLPARIYAARVLLLTGREKEGLRRLLAINAENPGQREVLLLLAAYATRGGYHEAAQQACRWLTRVGGATAGDSPSWSLAAWCSRTDAEACRALTDAVIRARQEAGEQPPWQLLVNKASLDGDVAAARALADRELGADFVQRPLALEHVPLVFNLALLLERAGQAMEARQLYIYLVEQHSHFRLPYFRLSEMDQRAGAVQRSVAWLTLLNQVRPGEATAEIAQRFFAERQVTAAADACRARSVRAALAMGPIYLWCCQQRGDKNRRFLRKAKDLFLYALHHDRNNIQAAHGLACCLLLEGDCDRSQALLQLVGATHANDAAVQAHHASNSANLDVLCGGYERGVKELQLVPASRRDWRQSTTLALCLAKTGRVGDAIAELTAAREKNPREPLLLYNLALLQCAAFTGMLEQRRSLTPADGDRLHALLDGGIRDARAFLSSGASGSVGRAARGMIKLVCLRCLQDYSRVNDLIRHSAELTLEQEEDLRRWHEYFERHAAEVRSGELPEQSPERQRQRREGGDGDGDGDGQAAVPTTISLAFRDMFMRDDDLRALMQQEIEQNPHAGAGDHGLSGLDAAADGGAMNFAFDDDALAAATNAMLSGMQTDE